MQIKKPPLRADTVSSRYAEVLFTISSQNEKIHLIQRDMDTLEQCVQQSEQFRSFLNDKTFKSTQQKEVIDSIGGNYDPLTQKFLEVLIDNRKLNFVPQIIKRYQQFLKILNQQESVKVISAQTLTNDQKSKLMKSLEKKYGHTNFEIEYEIQESILGGLQVYFGDTYLDASLKSRINVIQNELSSLDL